VLLVPVVRIRLNCVGVFDVVSYDPNLQSGSTQMERYKVCMSACSPVLTHSIVHGGPDLML